MSATDRSLAHDPSGMPSMGVDHGDGGSESGREFASRFARTVGGSVAAGMIAGFLVGGLGGRLVMRILAITSAPEATGILTENGNRIGEITLGGTFGLILVGSFVGTLGGVVYLAVRRWIPNGGWRQGLLFGLVLLCVFGRFLIDPENADFVRLRPHALAVVMFLALFPLFGLAYVPLADRLMRAFPPASLRRRATLAYAAPLAVLIPAFVALVVIIVFASLGWNLRQSDRLSRLWKGRTVQVGGYAAILVACALGLTQLVSAAAEIV